MKSTTVLEDPINYLRDSTSLDLFGVLIISYLFVWLVHTAYSYQRLAHIPGPFWAKFTGFWRARQVATGYMEKTNIELHRTYGRLVRIGPNCVSVNDSDAIKTIYSISGRYIKSAYYPLQQSTFRGKQVPNLFSLRDEAAHKALKRPVANSYSMGSLLQSESAISTCGELFISKLRTFAASGHTVDIGPWLQYYAFDVIGEVTFGRKLGFLEKGGDVEKIIGLIEKSMKYTSIIGQVPQLHKYLIGNPLVPYLLPQLEQSNAVLNYTLRQMERDQDAEGNDLLSKLLIVASKSPEKLPKEEIISHTIVNVFAGSDTTAIALRAMIYYLCKNPRCYSKLVAEIDDSDRKGELSKFITYAEAVRMPYLQSVMKEAMRIHPSVGLILERIVPEEGLSIDGKLIPKGTIVGINPWVAQRDPEIYGADVDVFRPERWLEANEEQLKLMERNFLNFGSGSRSCIGKNISIIEMNKIIPQLLRTFEIKLVHSDWTTENHFFVKQAGMLCILKERNNICLG